MKKIKCSAVITVLLIGVLLNITGCQLMGEDYEAGEKIGEGKCVSSGDSLEDMFK